MAEAALKSSGRLHASALSVAKRLMDLSLAAGLLLATAPVLALAAAAILLSSGTPVIHRRRVVGLLGKEFDAFKLRTMVPDADEQLARDPALRASFERNYKLERDPRVTRIGGVLRKWSIDELPQLVNVLRGEMSLIGPRMVSPGELSKYREVASDLLRARPGLSGVWQVSGRQRIEYRQRVTMDIEYLRSWSLSKDIGIALLTPWAILNAKGAK